MLKITKQNKGPLQFQLSVLLNYTPIRCYDPMNIDVNKIS